MYNVRSLSPDRDAALSERAAAQHYSRGPSQASTGPLPWISIWKRQHELPPERIALPYEAPFDFRRLFGMQARNPRRLPELSNAS